MRLYPTAWYPFCLASNVGRASEPRTRDTTCATAPTMRCSIFTTRPTTASCGEFSGTVSVRMFRRKLVGAPIHRHAFSRRGVVEGAFNLRHNRVMSWLLLHGEWDLNHHRRPDVPWLYLQQLPTREDERLDYGRQYLRLWRGPRMCTEPSPETLSNVPLSVHRSAFGDAS